MVIALFIIMLDILFLKKQKRKRQSEFEYWEEESYCPGVPVLPVGSFPFKVDKVSLEI